MGRNGVGKTTLVKLLCRLYDPTEGRILLDGIDLREFDSVALRKEISVIFQDLQSISLPLEHLAGAGADHDAGRAVDVEAAAMRAGAEATIRRLPKKYENVLGKWFEDGEELSIGEWQKVAIARAFYRSAQILVLDEPTSAVNPGQRLNCSSRSSDWREHDLDLDQPPPLSEVGGPHLRHGGWWDRRGRHS